MDTFIAHLASNASWDTARRKPASIAGRLPGRSPARARESRGAAMQYFTGSKAHNIVVRDRAIQRGLKLNEYGLFRVEDDSRVAGDTEEGIYQALDMGWVEPELGRTAERWKRRPLALFPVCCRSRTSSAICTCTRPSPTAATTSRRWLRPRTGWATDTSRSPTTAARSRWPTVSTSGAPWSTPTAFER